MNKILAFTLLVAVVFSCTDPYEREITPAYKELPLASYLESVPDRFSGWVEILKHTGFFSTMNLSANYTAFVPDNEAVERYLQSKGFAAVSSIPVEEARYLVKYHTIVGSRFTQSSFINGVLPDTTATGDFLKIEIREGGLNAIYINDEARVKQLDISATNGVIHALEDVLTPVTETIWEKINNDTFSIFSEAVTLTGYQQQLNTISSSEFNEQGGYFVQRRRFFTLFAVSNSVFEEANINSVADLKTYLGAEDDYTNENNALNKYVGYHILNQQLDISSLASFPEGSSSRNIPTLAKNELINVSDVEGVLFINFKEETEAGVSIVDENISTKNGLLHVVDGIMPVVKPPITRVVWELTDYPDLASLFPSNYRSSNLTSTFRGQIRQGDVTAYTWEAMPVERNNSALVYYVANVNDTEPHRMINHDALSIQLGIYGWVEMKTPAILSGTYSMRVRFYSEAGNVQRGRFMTIFNGSYLGSEIATHGLSSASQLRTTTIGNVVIPETGSYTVRLLATDNDRIIIDYIEFVPL